MFLFFIKSNMVTKPNRVELDPLLLSLARPLDSRLLLLLLLLLILVFDMIDVVVIFHVVVVVSIVVFLILLLLSPRDFDMSVMPNARAMGLRPYQIQELWVCRPCQIQQTWIWKPCQTHVTWVWSDPNLIK